MKRLLFALGLVCFTAAAGPAGAAELNVMEPKDRSIVKGTVPIKIRPQNNATEMFFENPLLEVQDHNGRTVQKLEAFLDNTTGICTAQWDTKKVRDGVYVVAITYRTLVRGTTPETEEDEVVVSVRNTPVKPARFTVVLADKPVSGDDVAEVSVKVLDAKGKPMPGARVTFKVDKGELDSDAELTDHAGEAFTTVDSEDVQDVTLTIQVEGLPPVKKVVKFVE